MRAGLSPVFLRATYAQESGEVLVPLVKLSHASWADDERLVPNHEAVTHDGEDYVPTAFNITLPDDDAEGIPVLQFTIDGVDQALVQKVRALTGKVTATVKWVLLSQPNVVEVEFPELEITAVDYDAFQVSGPISVEPILDNPFSSKKFTPSTAPGLF